MIYYFLAALGGFVVGIILSLIIFFNVPHGTLYVSEKGWMLKFNQNLEDLEKKRRIIFNVSKDKEVVTDENRA